jgi:hypothetical protein
MKTKLILTSVLFSAFMWTGNVLAQNNSVELTDDGPTVTFTGGVVGTDVVWTDFIGVASGGFQLDVQFDPAEFSFDSCSAFNAPYVDYDLTSCDLGPVANTVRVGLLIDFTESPPFPIPSGNLVTINFNVLADPGSYTLEVLEVITNDDETTDGIPANIDVVGPVYNSVPAPGPLDLGAVLQDDTPNPMATVVIDNDGGAPGSTLLGTCSVPMGTPFIVTNGTFSVVQGAAAHTVTVACDSTFPIQIHQADMACSNNDGNDNSDRIYGLSCNITPPGAAVFSSVPGPGSLIDITDGTPVPVGANPAAEPLDFTNLASLGDSDLGLRCNLTGASEITVSADLSAGIVITPQSTAGVTFDCNTSEVGAYMAAYACEYDLGIFVPPTNGFVIDGTANYTVSCDVRDAISEVTPSPASGTTLDFGLIQPGDSDTRSVDFNEDLGEDQMPSDAILGVCSIEGTDAGQFVIVAPNEFPQTIPSGGRTIVTVEGSGDEGGVTYTATLVCNYGDTDEQCDFFDGPIPVGCPQEARYPLTLEVGGDARFTVSKNFDDGDHDTPVSVTIDCFSGLPITQTQDATESQDVTFTVGSFESGELICDISETGVDGYTAVYTAVGDGGSSDADGCHFNGVEGGSENACNIVNEVDDVQIDIEKLWVIEGDGASNVDLSYTLVLYCDANIVNDSAYCPGNMAGREGQYYSECKVFNGEGADDFYALVTPDYPSSNCWVEEINLDDAVVVANGCRDMNVSAGSGDNCTIVNTLFFEGIPTLSQYGMAILALLMLGMGMVGFRRFV